LLIVIVPVLKYTSQNSQ